MMLNIRKDISAIIYRKEKLNIIMAKRNPRQLMKK